MDQDSIVKSIRPLPMAWVSLSTFNLGKEWMITSWSAILLQNHSHSHVRTAFGGQSLNSPDLIRRYSPALLKTLTP